MKATYCYAKQAAGSGYNGVKGLNALIGTVTTPTAAPNPPERAARAAGYLRGESELFLADLVVAETVYVLESFYETPRAQVAEVIRPLFALTSIVVVDRAVLSRAVEVYETDRLDFAEAYLLACAESTGVGRIASFDRSIDRVTTVQRIEASAPGDVLDAM